MTLLLRFPICCTTHLRPRLYSRRSTTPALAVVNPEYEDREAADDRLSALELATTMLGEDIWRDSNNSLND